MIKVTYKLEQYEICLLQAINCQLDSLYNDEIVIELRQIILQAISSGQIDTNQVKRLKELLVQFDTYSQDESSPTAEDEEFYAEWPEWKAVENANLKRKIMYLHHHLSNWLITQYVVYQKQLMYRPSKGIAKVLDPIIGIDREF